MNSRQRRELDKLLIQRDGYVCGITHRGLWKGNLFKLRNRSGPHFLAGFLQALLKFVWATNRLRSAVNA